MAPNNQPTGAALAALLLGDALLHVLISKGLLSGKDAVELVRELIKRCEDGAAFRAHTEIWMHAKDQLARTLERAQRAAAKDAGVTQVRPPEPEAKLTN